LNKLTAIGKVHKNVLEKDGRALVSKVGTDRNTPKEGISKALDLLGGLGKIVEEGDKILLKPNFNTGDAPPGSSDPDFVKAIIELLFEHGASDVLVGESSMMSASTRRIFEETGMLQKAKEAGAVATFFDEGRWVRTRTGGKFLKSVSLPEVALEPRKLVYVCCMKTHKWAKFTLSLKLAVGFMKPNERMRLHITHLEEKIADLNLLLHPHVVIMDGRRCFINGGPACGELKEPNLVLASGDRVALDVEAIKTIQSFGGNSLENPAWSYKQIKNAAELGLGAKNEQAYEVIET